MAWPMVMGSVNKPAITNRLTVHFGILPNHCLPPNYPPPLPPPSPVPLPPETFPALTFPTVLSPGNWCLLHDNLCRVTDLPQIPINSLLPSGIITQQAQPTLSNAQTSLLHGASPFPYSPLIRIFDPFARLPKCNWNYRLTRGTQE